MDTLLALDDRLLRVDVDGTGSTTACGAPRVMRTSVSPRRRFRTASPRSRSRRATPPRPDTHHVRTLAVHPDDRDRLTVAIEAGALVRSTDGGASWSERPPGSRRDNHALATHPGAPDRVYAAAGDGYAESGDAGATWQHPTEGLDHGYVWGLAVDPADPGRQYVSAAHGAYGAHRVESADAHVYRREGDGAWRRFDGDDLGAGLPVGDGVCRAVLAAPAAGELIVGTDRGVFRARY